MQSDAKVVSISVPDISSSSYPFAQGVLEVVAPSWTTASVTKESIIPCQNNMITVSLIPDIKVDTECVQFLTVSGLVGSTTQDSAGSGFSTASNLFETTSSVSFVSWDRAEGQLVLELGTNICFLVFTCFSFHFPSGDGPFFQKYNRKL